MFLVSCFTPKARAHGTFFLPSGKAYYGEYPLSFATCIGNKEVVTLLANAGASLFAKDTCLGNTALHMAVIYEQKEVYDHILDLSRKGAAFSFF